MVRTPSKRRPPDTARFDGTPDNTAEPIAELRHIQVDLIDLPANPARRFMGDITALAASMQDYGLQQPISVRAHRARFKVTSGTRRLAAARLLGWSSIVAFVRTLSADEAYLVDLVENLQREDLSAEEEADALGELVRSRGWTLQQVADALKRSVAYVSKRVRVFEDPNLREAVTRRNLPISTAEELLAAEPKRRLELIERSLSEGWDQVRAREAVRPLELKVAATATPSTAQRDRHARHSADSNLTAGSRIDARPRDFTRAVREFHRLILTIRAENLTASDRAALRSLFRDLILLGRAPTTSRNPVFPALPQSPPDSRSRPGRSRAAAEQKARSRNSVRAVLKKADSPTR